MDHACHILLLHEEQADRSRVSAIEEDGYAVTSAAYSEDIAELLRTVRPAIVIVDVTRPGEPGLEACRRVRGVADWRGILVALGAAHALPMDRLRYYQVGVDDLLDARADHDELLAKLHVYSRYKSAGEVDQMKSDLLALLNHETRTPLHGILSSLQMLMDVPEPSDLQRQELLTLAFDSATRVGSLLEKALLLGALRSGAERIAPVPVDVGALAEDVAGEFRTAARTRQVDVQVAATPGLMGFIDPEKTRLVLAVLLENAVRHAGSATPVELRVWTEQDEIRLAVSDQGTGIPAAVLRHIFDPLADPDIDHHGGGHWLSLPLAHEIIALHEGRLEVASREGAGTTFTVRFPRRVRLWDGVPAGMEQAA
jgi:signal transduction histidine kinase